MLCCEAACHSHELHLLRAAYHPVTYQSAYAVAGDSSDSESASEDAEEGASTAGSASAGVATGTIVGIVVGCVVLVAAIVGAVAFKVQQQRKRNSENAQASEL